MNRYIATLSTLVIWTASLAFAAYPDPPWTKSFTSFGDGHSRSRAENIAISGARHRTRNLEKACTEHGGIATSKINRGSCRLRRDPIEDNDEWRCMVRAQTACAADTTLDPATNDYGMAPPLQMGAIGDSLTVGFNADGLLDEFTNSWATGTASSRVNSHSTRLQRDLGYSVKTLNVAQVGARAIDLNDQVDKVVQQSPDYITVLIGPNDICNWSDNHLDQLAEFERVIDSNVSKLLAAKDSAKILLIPIPDMNRMYELGKDDESCQRRWRTFGICRRLLGNNRTDSDRQRFYGQWHDANQSLKRIAEKYAERVIFNKTLANYPFEKRHVSRADCFHPSVEGQALLSAETWRDTWQHFAN